MDIDISEQVNTEEDRLASADHEDADNSITKKGLSRKWLFFGLLLIVVAVAGSLYGVNRVVSDSNSCVDCHEMRPEYYTWANSSHSQIKCTDCHVPVNNEQKLIRNLAGFRQVFQHFFGANNSDITVWQQVTNQNCLQCHSKNRVVTPSGDLIISHSLHDQNNVQCISCHSGVVHGHIVERGKISQIPRENWTNSDGQTEAQKQYTKPQMIQCLECHRAWKVSTQCEKCHKKIPTPPSHQPETWKQGHGKEAWEDVNRCSKCHWEQGMYNTFDKKAVAQYIRANPFCYNCHNSYKPSSHSKYWAHDHYNQVTRGEVPYCIVCHDINSDGNKGMLKGTKTYCNQCHGVFYVDGEKIPSIDWIE